MLRVDFPNGDFLPTISSPEQPAIGVQLNGADFHRPDVDLLNHASANEIVKGPAPIVGGGDEIIAQRMDGNGIDGPPVTICLMSQRPLSILLSNIEKRKIC